MSWRVGRKVGRTIYNEHGDLVGMMDTPALAARVVDALNAAETPRQPPPRVRKPHHEKVVTSSWSDGGPLSVAVEVSGGSAQMFWLRFWRRDFTADAFIKVVDAEALHAELGAAIASAKAELQACAKAWAAELIARADRESEPSADEVPPPPAAG